MGTVPPYESANTGCNSNSAYRLWYGFIEHDEATLHAQLNLVHATTVRLVLDSKPTPLAGSGHMWQSRRPFLKQVRRGLRAFVYDSRYSIDIIVVLPGM